ncbi:MAG: type 1 glutamine amidotransferase [Eubacteriales bacterium]|nr:type 1 glutamine amidotransferase [Eubacteriales bacterium]
MVQHPLILISSGRIMGNLSMSRQQSELYGACLDAAGAAGALYTRGSVALLAERCDGLLLSGGGDVHPALFGQKRESDQLSIDPVRDAEEQSLFEAFFSRGKPILGVCRGIQVVNVFLGGTLKQHIDGHAAGCHPVACSAPLAALVGAAPTVNSYHHQAVERVAPPLAVAARAPDGTIEALRHPSAPLLGVQWHPERMVPPLCSDVGTENHLPLFEWLVRRC